MLVSSLIPAGFPRGQPVELTAHTTFERPDV